MFNFTFQGKQYNVKFRHTNAKEVAEMDADKLLQYNHVTTCTISEIVSRSEDGEYTFGKQVTGESRCSKIQKNNLTTGERGYNREDGREISLERALVVMFSELDDRNFSHAVSTGVAACLWAQVQDREQTWQRKNRE